VRLQGVKTSRLLSLLAVSATLVVGPALVALLPSTAGLAALAPPAPVVSVNVAEGAVLPLGDQLRASVAHGQVTAGAVVPDGGGVGQLGASDGTSWTPADPLTPGAAYTVIVRAAGLDGTTVELRRRFRVAEPAGVLTTDVTPFGDRVVGVGHPLVVRLSADVTDRAAVERGLTVTTSRPVGEAGWSWVDARELHYRPKEFWPANTSVVLAVRLAGVRAGDGLWGVTDRDVRFRTGAARVIAIDAVSRPATVTVDGAVVRRMPVSLGKPGYETRSGTKVVMDRHESYRMRSSTLGVRSGPESYDLVVPYAMRLTDSGEFLHGAPWAAARLGRVDGSHGCVNLSIDDARWLYDHVVVGDPVVTTGTGRSTEAGNGLGGGWNTSWSAWLAGSGLLRPSH